ncbi:MAG TPA: two-component regulator propeller domain-containing protein [Prolixibacteraceae bacterium]|nr:two-component regulator propeller domain-containing protein [Prolixibacteraceae bacterium]
MKKGSDVFLNTLFSVLFLCISTQAFSQKTVSNLIYKFSTEQGLSSNVIYAGLQDQKGFTWFATEEGLNKFDGKGFTHFTINKGRYALSHNRTQTMILAPDGNIWAGTSDGLNIYDYKSDSIIKVRTNTSPLKLVYNDITYLKLSNDRSRIWMGTYGNGINYFDWNTQQFHALSLPPLAGVAAPQHVMSILEDDDNRLWIGTQQNGLYRYDLKQQTMRFYELPEEGRFVRSIYQDSFRRIWIGTSKGCYVYNETSDRLEPVTYPENLMVNSVGAIQEDHNGKLWIGTEVFLMNFPVRSFSMDDQFAYQVIKHGASASRLNCPSVNSIFADQDNNIWIGTAWGGVNMLQGTSPKFKLYKHDTESPSSLPNSPIMAISSDRRNHLFIATMGTADVGFCKINLQNGEIIHLEADKKFPGYIYQSILFDSENNLWLGTYNKGLIKVDPNGSGARLFTYKSLDIHSLPDNDVRCIFEAKDHTIWIGTSSGLSKFDRKTQSVIRIPLHENRKIGIRTIREDANNTLWLGTYGAGVITYHIPTQTVNEQPVSPNPHIVSDMLINGDSVYITTLGEGLYLHFISQKKNIVFNDSSGLASNYLRSIVREKSGNIWIGNRKGISKLNPKTLEIQNFSSEDGIQNGEFTERAAVVLPDGQIAFGGFGGLNVFDPRDVTKNDKCPPIIFTKLLIFNEQVTPLENQHRYSPLKENITLADRIELKYDMSIFTLEFMGVNYNSNQKIQYAYFLEGSDEKWNNLGNQNSVTFRNLEPGEYIFKVKASSPDAVWSDSNIASIMIVVRPPFWATGWAYLIYTILAGVILYFIWAYVNVRIQAANHLRIERAKREKEEELHQEKLQFFTNISHEFRTPLTLIIGPLEKMQYEEQNEEKRLHFKLMLRNANRLLTMVNQLLDFRKAEKGQMKLKVQKSDLFLCIKDILFSFEDLRKQKDIQLEFNQQGEVQVGWFDPEFLTKSLTNLLSNAFKFTPEKGKITVSALVTKDALGHHEVEIAVTDNGKGISPKDINSIFDRFYQGKDQSNVPQGSGIGLHLVKNLIELHHGTIEVQSTPGVQTTFKISLPIEKSAYLIDEFRSDAEIVAGAPTTEPDQGRQLPELEPVSSAAAKEHKKRILVVEDNADIRSYIKSILHSEYLVEEAENGKAGLEMLTLHDIDLIVTDLMMPEMDGIEMAKKVKSSIETNHIPMIMLTAKSDIENRIEGLTLGADSYITKPFHPQHLIIRVAKLIEMRELLKERYSKKISLGSTQKPEANPESPDDLFMQKTISIILDKMIESEFNGDALAHELRISRMGLHRKIKALTGQSTGELIRNIRLKKASELLSINNKNISEVGYEVGFNSPSYFTTCFTEAFKMTPTEYSKLNRKATA